MRPFMDDVFEHFKRRDACNSTNIKVITDEEEPNSTIPVGIETTQMINIPIQKESEDQIVPLPVLY